MARLLMLDHKRMTGSIGWRECALIVLAAVVLVAGASDVRAQLVFVNAQDDLGPSPNLFCAAGGALSTCLENDGATVGNGRWGWIEAGSQTPGDVSNVYESNTEDSPELRMRVPAPNGSYDVYVMFWSDLNVSWPIRAGLSSNPGNNTLFGRNNANGATVAPFAASAVWATPPLNNSNAATDDDIEPRYNPLGGPNPFFDHIPSSGTNGIRMYAGQINTPGTPVMVTTGFFDIFIDDLPGATAQTPTRFDGVAYVSAGTNVFLTASVDRTTGNLSVTNPTATPINITRYSITSAAGALDSTKWDDLAGGNASINVTNPWSITSPASPTFSVSTLMEEGANGAVVNPGTTFNLGDVWIRSPFQDIQIDFELSSGAKMQILPTYINAAVPAGDLDGDGDVDFADFTTLMGNLHVPAPEGLTTLQHYRRGDLNNSTTVTRDDFFAFRTAYYAANPPGSGAASFESLVAQLGVPEPSTFLLATLGSGLLLAGRRRRWTWTSAGGVLQCQPRTGALLAACASLLLPLWVAANADAAPVTGWQRYQGSATTAIFLNGSEATASPIFGTGAANAIDDSGIWGSTPSTITLNPSEEAVLSGRVQLLGIAGAPREFRFGMWKKVVQPVNPNMNPTTGWLGYMALNGAGATAGRLEAKNPDSDFNNALFVSDQGGNSARTCCSGPIPLVNGVPVSPLEDGSVNGPNAAGTEGTPPNIPRYWILAESAPNNNAAFPNNQWFTFEIRVGRYGANEATVSASMISDDGAYVWNIGGGLDVNGKPPLNPTATGPNDYSPHVTFEFDRVGFLFGGALDADQAVFETIDISKQTIQTLDLQVNPTTGAARIRNTLPGALDITYYEISSETNSLREAGWSSLASASPGVLGDFNGNGTVENADLTLLLNNWGTAVPPVPNGWIGTPQPTAPAIDNDELTALLNNWGSSAPGGSPTDAWVEAGGSDDGFLAEASLGSLALNQGGSVGIGNIFKTVANGGLQGQQDLRFFVGLSNGQVLRGTVTYSAFGAASASQVPEPAAGLLLVFGTCGALAMRRPRWS